MESPRDFDQKHLFCTKARVVSQMDDCVHGLRQASQAQIAINLVVRVHRPHRLRLMCAFGRLRSSPGRLPMLGCAASLFVSCSKAAGAFTQTVRCWLLMPSLFRQVHFVPPGP